MTYRNDFRGEAHVAGGGSAKETLFYLVLAIIAIGLAVPAAIFVMMGAQ